MFNKLKVVSLFCVVVLFLPEGLCDDTAVFSELVNCTKSQSWCTNPCSGCSGVTCDSNNRITYINGGSMRLTCLPDSIGSLTSLTYLWLWLLEIIYNNYIYDRDLGINQLTSVPDSIGNLTSLKSLWLWLIIIYIIIIVYMIETLAVTHWLVFLKVLAV